MTITQDFLHFPGSATIKVVLRTYLDRDGQWWWLLTTEREGKYYVCSFGSLLPYLTGRTPHIVHKIGHCPICSGMDPLLWQDTDALVQEALADRVICERIVANLPMAELPTVDARDMDESMFLLGHVWGVIEDGTISGVYVAQMMGDLGGMPSF